MLHLFDYKLLSNWQYYVIVRFRYNQCTPKSSIAAEMKEFEKEFSTLRNCHFSIPIKKIPAT